MKLYELLDSAGRVFAFEIENAFISRESVVRVAISIPGTVITHRPRLLSWFREEQFCEFLLQGQLFVAWEPFGNNSRYWIGPEPPEWCPQVDTVRNAFLQFQPLLLRNPFKPFGSP
jgi:hypothetical protein